MASSKIKGITIEIGGNTTKLQDALKNVDKQVFSLNSDLKSLNQALKLDPKNTELLSQKQEVLARNIAATKTRLDTLKEAQRQMGSYTNLTDQQKEAYNQLSLEIAKSESALKSMNSEMKSMSRVDLSSLKEGLKKAGEVAADVAKTITAAVGAMTIALGKLVSEGVKSYASLEQNIGGVETLFKEDADLVLENARKAYKTAGVSANQYMEGVTSFTASLLQATAGDTKKAANIADMAFQDMSDNANKFGTDMASIQHAYQGFAKQNYTMLDNLKLGYGGTKKEMERLLKDAQKLTGIKYNINNLADVYNAIHAIQENLGVTGTTAKEAEDTISGSLNSMKAAFDNFLNGSGGVEELADSLNTFLKNILEAIKKIAPGLIRGIVQLFRDLVPTLASMTGELLPIIIQGAQDLIQGLIEFIRNDSAQFISMAVTMLSNLAMFILENLPILLESAIQIIAQLANELAKQAPVLIPAMVECILKMADALLDNIDLMVDAALALIIGLANGLIEATPKLIEKAPDIVMKLVDAIIENAPKMLDAAWQLIIKLAEGVVNSKNDFLSIGVKIVEYIRDGLSRALSSDTFVLFTFGIGGWIIKKIREGLGLGGSPGSVAGANDPLTVTGVDTGNSIIAGIEQSVNSNQQGLKNDGLQIGKAVSTGASSSMSNNNGQQIGKDFVSGVKLGVQNKTTVQQAVSAVQNTATSLLDAAKRILKINSPSKATEELGKFFDLGLKEGIENNANQVVRSATNFGSTLLSSMDGVIADTNSAMSSLTSGVNASVNPTINPTANSNPLYITIDKFYNNRETDIQQLAQEMEFYRKNSAIAKGGA